MTKKASRLILLVGLFLFLLSPALVQASSGVNVLSTSAEADFPASLNFNLSAASEVNITDIRLHYRVGQMSYAQVTSEVYIDFEPAATVNAKWGWDMRRTGGLPPGASVEYWWSVTDARGSRVETKLAIVSFDDRRYAWRSLAQDKITLYWYDGDDSFGRKLMAAAQQALSRLTGNTGAELSQPVKIYIYANSQDLQGSMIFPQEWTGGVAFSQYGIITIGIAQSQIDWGIRTIAHEFTHLVIHQMTFNPYSDLPTWLDEGLAMYNEGTLDSQFTSAVDSAIAGGSLISVRSLASPFSAFAGEAVLAYAESYSIVDFLIGSYGQAKMFELLNTFKQGSNYDEALVRVYGFDMDGLNTRWHSYITGANLPVRSAERGIPPALIGMLAGLATAIVLWLSLFIEGWAWRRGW